MTPIIRKAVRTALRMRPGYGKDEDVLLMMVNRLTGGDVDLQALRDAIEWNLAERLIRSVRNHESEQTEWFITSDGMAHDNI